MKVIDLLVRIANENEIPEKIKHENYIWLYDKDWKDYKNAQVGFSSYLISSRYHKTDFLNEKVEIIEDKPKKDKKYIEHIKMQENELHNHLNIIDKLNEIIDKINKGEE